MLIRTNAPVLGADRNPYQQPGQWQMNVSSRNLVSNDHYRGTEEQVQRQDLANYVTNRQNLADLTISRTLTKRVTLSVGVPYVNSSWARRDGRSPFPGPRREIQEDGRGIGDISVSSRFWIFNPDSHLNWNVAAGVGVKMPTGNSAVQDRFPDRNGDNNELRYVDWSVQPGDGGWGLMLDTQAFWILDRGMLFATGSYLANPRDTNTTPSGRERSGSPFYSVADQYLVRVGGSVPVWRGFGASLAWRMEGLKRYDLFGGSHGRRRPGTEMFIEPGISYSTGRHTFSVNIPIGYYYNRRPDPYTGSRGDATFPRQIFLTSYSVKFGGGPSASDQPLASAEPAASAAWAPTETASSSTETASSELTRTLGWNARTLERALASKTKLVCEPVASWQ